MPILADNGEGNEQDGKDIYGVVQMINKTEFDGQVLVLFSTFDPFSWQSLSHIQSLSSH